jgi:hypothetical protein
MEDHRKPKRALQGIPGGWKKKRKTKKDDVEDD